MEKLETDLVEKTSKYKLEEWAKELEREEYQKWSPDSLKMQEDAAKCFNLRMKRVAAEIREHVRIWYDK